MGLLLSVLVVCVGVLEVIACVRHFQDGYLPLWTPHCAVTSGFAITHDRWRKLPSFDYAKNDDEKHFEDLTGAKNGAVTLGLQDESVKTVENVGKTLHCGASLQDDEKVVSEIHLQESETIFVAQKVSDNLASANEPGDENINFTTDLQKQTVIDVFQSDIYNNNLVQTEHNLQADITAHTQDSTIRSDEAPAKKAELILQPPEDISDDSLRRTEEHENNDSHETTVVGTIHHEETKTHVTKANSSESDSRLQHQTSSSDAEGIQSEEIETHSQETPDSEIKHEVTPEELIERLKKTPSPVRISPPTSTPPLTPKKSKADISWPTFFPGAPVIKRPSVSFATPEALLAGEDPEPHPRNDEEERPVTPPPIIKRSKENTPVQSDLESRSVSSESVGEDVDQEEEEEDIEDEHLFSGVREKSPTSIISGNDFSKKELELQRRKSYKLKRFNSAVETVSRDEEAEDRSFSEDKKGVSHAVKSREPKRKFKKPLKATSFEDAMLRDVKDVDVVDGGTTLKLSKEVKFVDEPIVVAEEEEIFLEQEVQTPQEEIKTKTDEGLDVSFGQMESEPEKCVVPEEEKQLEKHDFTESKEPVRSEQKIFDESEDIKVHHEKHHGIVLNKETETEPGGQRNKGDEIHQQAIGVNMGMQDVPQVNSKNTEVKSSEILTTKLNSKQGEEKDDVLASKEVVLMDNSEMHSKSAEFKPSDEISTKFGSKQSEETLEDKQALKEKEEKKEEEEIEEWVEEEIILGNSEVPANVMDIIKNIEVPTKLDTKQREETGQTKQGVTEEVEIEEEEEEEEEEETEQPVMVDNSKVHSKSMEINSRDEMSTKLDTRKDEKSGQNKQIMAEEEVEEEEEEVEEEEEEEEEEIEEQEKEIMDNSKLHTKTMEASRSADISTKLDTRQDKETGQAKDVAVKKEEEVEVVEEEEVEEEEEEMEEEEEELEEEQAVMQDKSKSHSKTIGIKSSEEISVKAGSKQDVKKGETEEVEVEKQELVEDNSKVHSKAMEIRRSDEIPTKTKQDEQMVIDTSKVHSKHAETKPSEETTTKVLAKQGEEEDEGLTRKEKQSDEGQQQTGVRFAEPERTTKVVEGDHEEDQEDSSSYTYSDSTQQKTPPKEAFWMEKRDGP